MSFLDQIAFDTEYRTGEVDLSTDFYRPCFRESIRYDRAVGYFRSSALAVYGFEVIDFVRRGGRIRLVCSPEMSAEDIRVVSDACDATESTARELLLREIEQLLSDDLLADCAKVLGALVRLGSVELKIAIKPDTQGIYHEKIGLFHDSAGNTVSFLGSSNETWSGLHRLGNYERNEVFCSWRGDTEARRVKRHRDYFERLWDGHVAGIRILSFPDAAHRKLLEASPDSLDAAEELIRRRSASVRRTFTPRDHQRDAVMNWRRAGYRGVLEHATGSGKTITAIMCLTEHAGINGPAIVLVPSTLLLRQWTQEVAKHFPEAAVLAVGGGNSSWREPGVLRNFTAPNIGMRPRVVIATMQTACTDGFLTRIAPGEHLMVVADEVHQVGAPALSRTLSIDAGKRLGLSATPQRHLDPAGTARIFDYFGPRIEPPFTLRDAINSKALCEYEYYPHAVALDEDEAAEWSRITRSISMEIAREGNSPGADWRLSEKIRLLLIRRAQIAKTATNKVRLAIDVVRQCYQPGHRWLIYCDNQEQMRDVANVIRETISECAEFHSAMTGDRDATLNWFERFGGVLVAINCLDEGVDIPLASHALILASSQNPRQFIQRRGRVLRRADGKTTAVIHDAIVVPLESSHLDDQLGLAFAELARGIRFADDALNPGAAIEIRKIAISIGIDPDDLQVRGLEEDVADEQDTQTSYA